MSQSLAGRMCSHKQPLHPVNVPCLHARSLVYRHSVPRQGVRARSAAGLSGAGEDPYKVLGITPDADSNEINRAFRAKKFEAKNNPALLSKLEAAHTSLMMSALSARLQGKNVNKSVLYADREPLFPWRPKRWDATPKVIMIVGALQLAMASYGFQSPNMGKAIGSMLIGIAGNVMKQNAIAPPPRDASMATEEEAGRAGRNFIRGVLLGIMATVFAIMLATLPEYIAQWMKMPLPAPLNNPGFITSLKIACTAACNWVMTSFYY